MDSTAALPPVASPEPDEVSARIIAAAIEEIAQFGISRARMSEIARRAGVSSATLYRRFADKDALLQAALLSEVARFGEMVRAIALRQKTPEDTVVEPFVGAFLYLRDETILLRLLETEPDAILPSLTTRGEPLLRVACDYYMQLNQEARFVDEADWDRELAEVRIEMLVRLTISLLIAPPVKFDLSSEDAIREFTRAHIAPMIVQAPNPRQPRAT